MRQQLAKGDDKCRRRFLAPPLAKAKPLFKGDTAHVLFQCWNRIGIDPYARAERRIPAAQYGAFSPPRSPERLVLDRNSVAVGAKVRAEER